MSGGDSLSICLYDPDDRLDALDDALADCGFRIDRTRTVEGVRTAATSGVDCVVFGDYDGSDWEQVLGSIPESDASADPAIEADADITSNGTVYRGREVRQTDAAFFSRECWYVLSLALTDDGPAPSLSLASVDDAVREALDGMLAERGPHEAVSRDAAGLPRPLLRFVAEADYVLTHAAVLEPSLRPGS